MTTTVDKNIAQIIRDMSECFADRNAPEEVDQLLLTFFENRIKKEPNDPPHQLQSRDKAIFLITFFENQLQKLGYNFVSYHDKYRTQQRGLKFVANLPGEPAHSFEENREFNQIKEKWFETNIKNVKDRNTLEEYFDTPYSDGRTKYNLRKPKYVNDYPEKMNGRKYSYIEELAIQQKSGNITKTQENEINQLDHAEKQIFDAFNLISNEELRWIKQLVITIANEPELELEEPQEQPQIPKPQEVKPAATTTSNIQDDAKQQSDDKEQHRTIQKFIIFYSFFNIATVISWIITILKKNQNIGGVLFFINILLMLIMCIFIVILIVMQSNQREQYILNFVILLVAVAIHIGFGVYFVILQFTPITNTKNKVQIKLWVYIVYFISTITTSILMYYFL